MKQIEFFGKALGLFSFVAVCFVAVFSAFEILLALIG
jgi:hypothetical protein